MFRTYRCPAKFPALAQLTLDAVAALQGLVQTGDGMGLTHGLKMQLRPADRESSGVVLDLSSSALRRAGTAAGSKTRHVDRECTSEAPRTPAGSPIHARPNFGTGRGHEVREDH